MAETLRLTIMTGSHQGRRFCFRAAGDFLVGRAADCFVHLNGSERDRTISRHHCRLLVDPPLVNIQDLDSLNGTFINGQPAAQVDFPLGNVHHGDVVTVGGTSCLCEIVDCPPALPPSHEPVWKEGEIAKDDCPVPCSAERCEPFRGCCAGGWGVTMAS